MALRGTGFAKRPAGTAAIHAASTEHLPAAEAAPTRAVPLDLAALVAPYRRQGRISLRVERLPHRARLSRGQNNGDRSWSLSFDELEGLHYLAPKDLAHEHTLSIRVVSLDGSEGATVAMLELSIPASEIPRIATIEGDRSRHEGDQSTANRLRAELAEARAALSAQDALLADQRQALESDSETRARQIVHSELASARAAWDAETKARMAEIAEQNAANLEQSRRTWQAEHDSRLAKAELEAAKHLEQARERWWKEFNAKLAQAEQGGKASEAARLAAEDKLRLLASKSETYERARSEFEADLSKAKAEWKESETTRLAEAEAQWQSKATALQSEVHERLRKGFESDLVKLRKAWQDGETARLADAEASWRARSEQALGDAKDAARKEAEAAVRSRALSEWKAQEESRLSQEKASWQQQAAKDLAEARARTEKDIQLALETAQRAWKASEVARFAAAETRWREESAKLIADARERASGGQKSDDDLQIGRLQEDLVAANAALVNREAELAQLRQNLDDAGDSSRKGLETALANARKTWSEEEAARLLAAEQQWGERSTRELSELRAQQVATASDDAAGQQQLRDELAAAKAAVVERESELMRVRSAAQVESQRQRLESEAAMIAATNAWRVAERTRIDAIEEKWREQVAAAQADSSAQSEQQREVAAPAASEPQRDGIEMLRLRDELEKLTSKMAVRDVELAQARANAEQARARLIGEPIDLIQRGNSDRILISTGRNRSVGLPERKRLPYRDIGIVAAVAILAFLFYPYVVSWFDWGSDSSYSDDAAPAPKPVAPKPVVVVKTQPTDVIVKSANIRSAPARTATLISTLAADVSVRTIERSGNWVHIEFTTVDAKKQDGWVYNTYLKSLSEATTAAVAKPVAVEAKPAAAVAKPAPATESAP